MAFWAVVPGAVHARPVALGQGAFTFQVIAASIWEWSGGKRGAVMSDGAVGVTIEGGLGVVSEGVNVAWPGAARACGMFRFEA